MSENSFPFEGAAEPAPLDDTQESGSRKMTLVAGGLIASLVLGAGGFFLFGSGGSDDDDVALPVSRPQAAAPAEAEPAPVEVVPVASTEQLGRSPFKVGYIEPKAAPAKTETTSTTDGTEGTVGGSTGTTTGTTSTTTPLVDDGKRLPVSLLDVDRMNEDGTGPYVVWATPDGEVQVLPGDVFGRFQHLRVLQILRADDAVGVVLQIGDATLQVPLGESAYVW